MNSYYLHHPRLLVFTKWTIKFLVCYTTQQILLSKYNIYLAFISHSTSVPAIKSARKFKVGEEDDKCGLYHTIIFVYLSFPESSFREWHCFGHTVILTCLESMYKSACISRTILIIEVRYF